MSTRGPRRPVLAALLIAAVAAGLVAAWWAATDGYECEATGPLACAGPGLLVALLGVPTAFVLGVVCFRVAGASSGFLGVLGVFVATWALVLVSEPLEPPVAIWPLVAGALAAIYLAIEDRLAPRTTPIDQSRPNHADQNPPTEWT